MSDIVEERDIVEQLREYAAVAFSEREANMLICAVNEIVNLREAIRRLADQDATLSVCDGNVTVTMDATLTDDEREAINMSRRILVSEPSMNPAQRAEWAITLSRLLDRTGFAK